MKQSNSIQVKRTLKFTSDASILGAALGSIPVVYIVAHGAAINYLGVFWVSVVFGVLAVALYGAVVEYGMKTYFPYGIQGILSGDAFRGDWRTSALFLIITGLGAAMMFSSGYMSFEGRKEAANIVAGETNTASIDQIAANIGQSETKLLRVARSEKAATLSSIKARKKEIEQAQSNLVELKQSGNTWAANKLQRIIDSDTKLKQLENELKQHTETITGMLKQSGVSKAVETVSAENALKLDIWQQRHQTSKALVGLFGIACILIFAFASITLALFEIVEQRPPMTATTPKARPVPPSEVLPVSNSGFETDRKADAALKQSFKNREEIETLKQKNSVSEIVSSPVSPEISETETVLETKPETLKQFQVVSKGNQKAVWVPGFESEPFSLSQCKSKLKQYENKLKKGIGKKETAERNITNFKKAIKILS